MKLKARGIACDCIACYPWRHESMQLHDQNLGFDYCGIFYIGGQVEVKLGWGMNGICKLTAVAGPFNRSRG